MKLLRVGIIGCGTIGTEIARACKGRLRRRVTLAGVTDVDENRLRALGKSVGIKIKPFKMEELIRASDLVVEAASANISAGILKRCIALKKSCLIMSVGGMLGHEKLLKDAEAGGIRVYIPSGAIGGIDALKAAYVGSIDSVTLTTMKPPKGLEGAPYIKANNIDLSAIKNRTVIFEGSAEEAVSGFPQNVNVSAVLSIAGIGAKRTRVRIVTSPDYTVNIHEIEINGSSGKIAVRTENVPSAANPKTSALAIFSAIAALEGATSSVRIGT